MPQSMRKQTSNRKIALQKCLEMPKGERIGFEWLDLCQKHNCEVFQAPANISHFFQPCDQFVNKALQGAVRDMRDKVTSMAIGNTKSVHCKIMCGVFGFHRISTRDIRKAFQVTNFFPWTGTFRRDLSITLILSSTHLSNLPPAPQANFRNTQRPHAPNRQTHC